MQEGERTDHWEGPPGPKGLQQGQGPKCFRAPCSRPFRGRQEHPPLQHTLTA